MKLNGHVLAVMALALGAVAEAQPATPASVDKLFEVTRVRAQFDDAMRQVAGVMQVQMRKGAEARGVKLQDPEIEALVVELTDRVVGIVREEMNDEATFARLAEAYAGVYTEEEVQAQIAFYSTPVGRKVIERTPELTKASMAIALERMPAVEARVMALATEFEARSLEIRARRLREQGGR